MKTVTGKKIQVALAIALAMACTASGCSDDVVEDPTFRQWCGDTLCAWALEEGAIQRAPTWHHDDYGVEFTGTPTRISQYSKANPSCLLFTAVADVDPRAQMTVEIDFNSDGKVDYSWPVPSSNWHSVQTLVTAPRVLKNGIFGAWDGFTIAIRKSGPGRAVLAQMRVQGVKDCDASAAVQVDGIALTNGCGPDAACASGVCCMPFDGTHTSITAKNLGYCTECCPGDVQCLGTRCGAPSACGAGTVCRGKANDYFSGFSCRTPLLKAGDECTKNEDCASKSCSPNYVVPDGGVSVELEGPFQPYAPGCLLPDGGIEPTCVPEVQLKTYCR